MFFGRLLSKVSEKAIYVLPYHITDILRGDLYGIWKEAVPVQHKPDAVRRVCRHRRLSQCGSHHYKAYMGDFCLYRLRDSGVLCGSDYYPFGVTGGRAVGGAACFLKKTE